MAKIETKEEVLYDARDYKFGKIVIEMKKEKVGNMYNMEITDFVETTLITEVENGEPLISISTSLLRTKPYQKSVEEIDALYAIVNQMVDLSLPFTQRQDRIEALGLLLHVQNDFLKNSSGKSTGKTVYNLSPNVWQIKE